MSRHLGTQLSPFTSTLYSHHIVWPLATRLKHDTLSCIIHSLPASRLPSLLASPDHPRHPRPAIIASSFCPLLSPPCMTWNILSLRSGCQAAYFQFLYSDSIYYLSRNFTGTVSHRETEYHHIPFCTSSCQLPLPVPQHPFPALSLDPTYWLINHIERLNPLRLAPAHYGVEYSTDG